MSLFTHILFALATLFVWMGAASLVVNMPPIIGALWVSALIAMFLGFITRRAGMESRFRPMLVITFPSGAPLTALALAMIAVSVFYVVFQTYYFQLMPPRVETTSALALYAQQPLGWIPSILATVVLAPIVEEFAFRGWILRAIERRAGTLVAIVGSALLFAAIHLKVWDAPFHMVSGLLFAIVVTRTRSIWAAILIHVTANGTGKAMSALAGEGVRPDRWLDIAGVPDAAQPLVAVCAVLAVVFSLSRLSARVPPNPSPASELALATR